MRANILKQWVVVGLVALAHLLAAPRAGGFVRRALGPDVVVAGKGAPARARPGRVAKTLPPAVATRRRELLRAAAIAAVCPILPPRTFVLAAPAPAGVAPRPIALLALAPKRPPPGPIPA